MLHLALTGRVALRAGDRVVDETSLAGRLGRTLLTRLALARYPVARPDLIDDLWPDGPPPAVDSVLNATVSRLRAAMSTLGVDGRAVVVTRGGTAELRLPPGSRIDVVVAAEAVDRAESALRKGTLREAWADAVVAHAIARRPLLPGVEGVWLDLARDRLTHVHERSLAALADVWLALGDAQQSTVMARELVRCAPLAESSHRRLVAALLAADDRPAATAAVADWRRTVTDVLGLPADGRLHDLLDTH